MRRVDMQSHIAEKGGVLRNRGFWMVVEGARCQRVALIAAGLLAAAFWARPAHADFRVCNATQSLVGVAIGYRAQDGWKTEGWWQVEGSRCKTLIEGPLQSRFYYLYAEDAEHGGRWDGPINMCVAEKEFKITGAGDCFTRGYQRAGFKEYDTGEQSSWMVQLTDDQNAVPPVGGTAEPAPTTATPQPGGAPPPAGSEPTAPPTPATPTGQAPDAGTTPDAGSGDEPAANGND